VVTVRESIQRATTRQRRASPQQRTSEPGLTPQQLDLIRLAQTTRAASHARIDAAANAAYARIQQLTRRPL
jgi:hypothetical protein